MAKKKYICKCCGKEYFSYKEKSNYCSHKCRIEHNTFIHYCEYCGKEIRTIKSIHLKYISHEMKHLYCSKECTNKAHTTKITKTCEFCGKEFKITNCLADIQKYCSRTCYENARVKILEKICPICGKKFSTYHKNQIFCSKQCRGKSIQNRIICKCENCGKEFERIESEVIKNNHHYCSNQCRYDAIRWNVSDITILRNNYRKIKTKDIQKLLSKNYSQEAIKNKARTLGLSRSRTWSKEEEKIIVDNYDSISLNKLLCLLPNRSLPSIMHKARQYNLLSNFYINHIYRSDEIEFLKNNYLSMSDSEIAKQLGRTESGVSQKLRHLQLYRPHEIKKDGYGNLNVFVRSSLAMWKEEVRKQYNYTCYLTGSKSNLIIHHCRSFNLLFEETIDILNFPEYDTFEEYTDKELLLFSTTFMDLQEYYNAYVCITGSIHKLFHKEYGYGDNTEEQWEEFVNRYRNGYYKNIA